MKKILLTVFIFSILIAVVIYAYQNDLFNKKPAGLEINTNPTSRVFLNGVDKGLTPFSDKNLDEGEYTLKLIPSDDSSGLSPYETKLNLLSRATTIVSRSFAASEADSSGFVLELGEEVAGKSYLSVISDPDTANLTLDGKPTGYTPASRVEVSPGSHEIALSSPGYKPQNIAVSTISGFNLIAKVKLGAETITLTPPIEATEEAEPQASPSPSSSAKPVTSPLVKPYIIIEETGTGWLRVRKDPSSTGEELGKADVGDKLKYLGETTEDGWHQVEFAGASGWVSGKFATLVK